MSLPGAVRTLVPLFIGLALGALGASLFRDSLPGQKGSTEERAQQLEHQLEQTQSRLTALEAAHPTQIRGRSVADGARTLAEDFRDGKPVTPDDVFRASQPLLRDLAPLFDRMRAKQEQEMAAAITGEFARKYHLSPDDQAKLKAWFAEKSEQDAKRFTALATQDGTRLEDLMRASQTVRPDEGLDTFMGSMLTGDQLTAFQADRLAERVTRVQQEADSKVQRLDSIVQLDETQRDQVYAVMARSSRDYDPSMAPQGAQGAIGSTPGGDRETALMTLLRPDQRAAYEAERQHQRDQAGKNLEAIGLSLPQDWDMFGGEDLFR